MYTCIGLHEGVCLAVDVAVSTGRCVGECTAEIVLFRSSNMCPHVFTLALGASYTVAS